MINEQKKVRDFCRKYNVKEVNRETIGKIIEAQGYTIVPYNRFQNSEKVQFLITSLGVDEYVKSCYCFTYQDDKYRLVFINNELNDDEALIVLAHEEGHIWHSHVVSESVFGADVQQEFEANEFVHYLLNGIDNGSKKQLKIALCSILAIAILVSTVLMIKGIQNKKTYTDNYYRTDAGTKYHIEGCIYIKNKKEIRKLSKEEFESGAYEPCAVCIQFEDND